MNKKIIVITLVLSFIFLSCESGIALHIEKETNGKHRMKIKS